VLLLLRLQQGHRVTLITLRRFILLCVLVRLRSDCLSFFIIPRTIYMPYTYLILKTVFTTNNIQYSLFKGRSHWQKLSKTHSLQYYIKNLLSLDI
jgi:hypothetical protein